MTVAVNVSRFGLAVAVGVAVGVGIRLGGLVGSGVDPRSFKAVIGAVIALEERVLLQLLFYVGKKIHGRELQQLNRLLQLRRHDERLGLAQFKARDHRHGGNRPSPTITVGRPV